MRRDEVLCAKCESELRPKGQRELHRLILESLFSARRPSFLGDEIVEIEHFPSPRDVLVSFLPTYQTKTKKQKQDYGYFMVLQHPPKIKTLTCAR